MTAKGTLRNEGCGGFPLVPAVKSCFHDLLDLMFPPRCLRCGERAYGGEHREICRRCRRSLALLDSAPCPGCGRGTMSGPMEFCRSCRGRYFRDGLLAAAPFRGTVRGLIHQFKYRGDFPAGHYLALLLSEKVRGELPDCGAVVVPVPLSRRRLRHRGYNQAALLAREIARREGLRLELTALARVRDTRPLAGLERRERVREVRGSIRVRDTARVEGRKVLVVDDVFTTGATAEECCRVLKGAGASRTVFASIARA